VAQRVKPTSKPIRSSRAAATRRRSSGADDPIASAQSSMLSALWLDGGPHRRSQVHPPIRRSLEAFSAEAVGTVQRSPERKKVA
jgi:hypothetical protein